MFVEYDTPQQHEQFLKEKKKKKDIKWLVRHQYDVGMT